MWCSEQNESMVKKKKVKWSKVQNSIVSYPVSEGVVASSGTPEWSTAAQRTEAGQKRES